LAKLIPFPKNQNQIFLEAVKLYEMGQLHQSQDLFNKLREDNLFKKYAIKYSIEINIQFKRYEHVYSIIEDEFVNLNLSEDYLIDRYIYTMILDSKYNDAVKMIDMLVNNNCVTNPLVIKFSRYKQIIQTLASRSYTSTLESYLSSKRRGEYMFNIDERNLNWDELSNLLVNAQADSLVKYHALKKAITEYRLHDIEYINCMGQRFTINSDNFVDIEKSEIISEVVNRVYESIIHYSRDIIIDKTVITNIWVNEYLRIYPNSNINFNRCCFYIHKLILELLNEKNDNKGLLSLYNIDNIELYDNFNVKHFTNYQFML
jgi:hypothetical protein